MKLVPSPSIRYVTLKKFSEFSGYSVGALRMKISRGELVQNKHFRLAPDGRVLIDLQGFEQWVESASRRSRRGSKNTTAESA
jgi:hypothetical protein